MSVFVNEMWLGNAGILLNTAGSSSSANGAPCARHERTDNPRRISSEFPKRHVCFFPPARKAAVPRLLMRDMFVVTLIEESIKMLLFRSYQRTLQLGFPGKYIALVPHPPPPPPKLAVLRRKHSLSWKKFHLCVKSQILQQKCFLCIKQNSKRCEPACVLQHLASPQNKRTGNIPEKAYELLQLMLWYSLC